MEQKIKQISEAFSMQPKVFSVTPENELQYYYDKENAIKEIRKEYLCIAEDSYWYFVGYDYGGRKQFQYLASTCNIEYYYD